MVAHARCLPRILCCCYAGASAESVRFLVFCLGCWPKPWGWTASPGAPHLGASSLRRRTAPDDGSRPSAPARCSTVTGSSWRGASSSLLAHHPGVVTPGRLGLPGLLRRPRRRSHTSGTGPTPRLDLASLHGPYPELQ